MTWSIPGEEESQHLWRLNSAEFSEQNEERLGEKGQRLCVVLGTATSGNP